MPPETPLQPVTIGDIPEPQEQPEQPSAIEVPAVEHGPLESMNETPEIPVQSVQASPGQLPVATESGAETRTEQLDILVAEDNEVNQIVVRQILEETGASFEIYENGRLALEAFKVAQPRMVLMDVSMPEMNGKEATIAIRQFEEANNLARTPIVGVTAHALKGDKESCLEVGMDDYLSKPVSPNRMVEKVNQWLQHSKKSEQVA
ncbi:MAG: response regulator [Rhizobiaceae bacterium]|nr:response regulator [Rhizobiaceae bacterium]